MGKILTRRVRDGRTGRLSRTRLLPAIAGMTALCLIPAQSRAAVRYPGSPAAVKGGSLGYVSCVSAADCWAAGGRFTDGGQIEQPFVEHWDGSGWASVRVPRSPGTGTVTGLTGISCASSSVCWAIGVYMGRHGDTPFAERWNGSRWSLVRLPRPPRTGVADLVGLSCASTVSCWAIGPSDRGMFTEHWNGRAWSVAFMAVIGFSDDLQTLTCTSDRNCWAVGIRSGATGTAAAHWNGHRWSQVHTPTSHSYNYWLLGVGCSGSTCMAVGRDSHYRVLALRWDGSAWQVTRTPATRALLGDVACASASLCLSIGSHDGTAGRAVGERWDGTLWHAQPIPVPPGSSAAGLGGITCVTAADCWAVGGQGRSGLVYPLFEHWNGKGWSVVG